MDGEWQELYRSALLELRPEELRQRIDNAERAIQKRMVELRRDDSDSAEESQALDDALRGLCVLRTTECSSPYPAFSSPPESEAVS
jgi:hypothetical protein